MAATPLTFVSRPAAVRFVKTERQRELCALIQRHQMVMAEGGARSGKTFLFVREQIKRGVMVPSRHLAARFRAIHARASLMRDTVPKVMATCFPGLPYRLNKSEMILDFPSVRGGRSEYWIAGVDDENRMDKVLGNEFSDALLNECSQIPFDAAMQIRSRLAENSGLPLKLLLDQNPPAKSWWTYKLFHQRLTPRSEPVDWDFGLIRMNPVDNAQHLSAEYIELLRTMPKRQRDRFYLGLYSENVEGALWTDEMVNWAKLRLPGERTETVVAIDPSVSTREDSDECGLIVASRDHLDGGIVHEDASGKMSTDTWARRAVALYHEWRANVIVAEVNQGGDLVEQAIHNVDRTIPVVKVWAAHSKYARAEPVAQLFEDGRRSVTIEGDWPMLEEELTTYVPRDAKHSPNRLDAMVWALTYLILDQDGRPEFVLA